MAKRVKNDVIASLKEELHHFISARLAIQEQKQKLLNRMTILKTRVSAMESELESFKLNKFLFHNLVVVQHQRFSGIQSVKCQGIFVFEFSMDNVPSNDRYMVEILIDEHGCGKLRKWVLPMSTNIQEILSQHPIDNLNNMRQFFESCKHHVDCYTCRVKQIEGLQVSGLQTEFLWKPIAAETDKNNLDTSGESLENAGFLSTYFHQDQKETKKGQKKDRNNEQDRRSVSRDNETEESLRVKGERRKDTDVEEDNKKQVAFPRDDKKVKPRKHQQSARTTMKLLDAKKSLDDSRKSNREVANVEKSNVTDERKKPESKFTSAASRIQHKQSKKRQTDTEDAQIENNNTSSKNKNNHGNKKN